MSVRIIGIGVFLVATMASSPSPVVDSVVPLVDHHQHLLSPTLATRLMELPAAIELPPELRHRFGQGLPRFNNAAALEELYTEDAVLVFSLALQGAAPENWIHGRQRIANFLAGAFRSQYSITP